ncbi:uncharacterized protein EDB93DRAFT_1118098 [Suillus bovinus]|uniref:uncharacterized protein n=1 Tax=Suillus bovinus TaxID=48563 RepID=UPI001B86A99F|nr:uncharacterized protein EDB93DRAFT_1118098 [Suillus bovinus]KAG2159104.1 hypothetical protein EDB93DRAFT_1118098 [Suillus bovinus]
MASFNNGLAIDPFEDRNIVVADITTNILHAPQPQRRCLNTIPTSYSPVGNQAIGLSIPRPSAPIFNQPQPHHALLYDNISSSSSSHTDSSNEHHITHPCSWDDTGTPCGYEFISKNIVAHFRQHHQIDVDSDKSFTCCWITPNAGRCGRKFKVGGFERHIVTHIGIKFRCSVCRKRMAARKDLAAKHRRYHAACTKATFDTIRD